MQTQSNALCRVHSNPFISHSEVYMQLSLGYSYKAVCRNLRRGVELDMGVCELVWTVKLLLQQSPSLTLRATVDLLPAQIIAIQLARVSQ